MSVFIPKLIIFSPIDADFSPKSSDWEKRPYIYCNMLLMWRILANLLGVLCIDRIPLIYGL